MGNSSLKVLVWIVFIIVPYVVCFKSLPLNRFGRVSSGIRTNSLTSEATAAHAQPADLKVRTNREAKKKADYRQLELERETSKKIREIFSTSKSAPEYSAEIRALVNEYGNDLNRVHAVTLLHQAARAGLDITRSVPLDSISVMLQRAPGSRRSKIRTPEIAQAFYGLKMMSLSTPGIRAFLQELNQLFIRCDRSHFGRQEIGNILFGLQKFSVSPEIVEILRSSIKILQESTEELQGQEISNALYGEL